MEINIPIIPMESKVEEEDDSEPVLIRISFINTKRLFL